MISPFLNQHLCLLQYPLPCHILQNWHNQVCQDSTRVHTAPPSLKMFPPFASPYPLDLAHAAAKLTLKHGYRRRCLKVSNVGGASSCPLLISRPKMALEVQDSLDAHLLPVCEFLPNKPELEEELDGKAPNHKGPLPHRVAPEAAPSPSRRCVW